MSTGTRTVLVPSSAHHHQGESTVTYNQGESGTSNAPLDLTQTRLSLTLTPFSACHGYCHGYPTGRVWAGPGEGLGEGSGGGAVRVWYFGCASQYPATSEPFSDSVLFTPFSA